MKSILYKYKQVLLCIVIFSNFNVISYSQIDEITFERISLESGLSQSSVLCICQDRRGFFWFGTYDGLNRFDGYQFKIYKTDPKNNFSLSNNHIGAIIEDKYGEIWIGTEDGLNRFDKEKERFITYKNIPYDPNSLSNNYIRYLFEDRSGTIWVGTYGGGLNRFDREKNKFTRYLNDPGNSKSLSNNRVLFIFEDRKKNLWVGTDYGLNYMNRKKGEFTYYLNDPNNPTNNAVTVILEENAGEFWIGTWGGGLCSFNVQTKKFINYKNRINDPNSLSNNIIRSIYKDPKGYIWVGTDGGGIDMFKPKPNREKDYTFFHLRNSLNDPNSLSSNSVLCMYEDKSGILWLGTDFGGINKFNMKKRKLQVFRNRADDPNSLCNNSVWAVCEDNSGTIWIGTKDGGLDRFDRKENKFIHYINNPKDTNSLSNNNVRTICKDFNGLIWIGTDDGLNQLNPTTNKFTRYYPELNNPNSLCNKNIWHLFKDKSGNIWIGTTEGLNKYDYNNRKFIRYRNDTNNPSGIGDDYIWSLYEDNKGMIWIGTLNRGLFRFDPKTESFRCYQKTEDNNSLCSNKVLCIYEDSKGTLWVGVTDGLCKMNPNSGTFTCYSEKDGLPNASIQGILEDEHGNLWVSTKNGLSKFNPNTIKFKNYFESDGFQGNEYTINACCKLKSGEMIFGGTNGLNIFHPDSIKDNLDIPTVVITDFQIYNKPVPIGDDKSIHPILSKSITESKEITLSYKENIFSFEFAALHYVYPLANQYAYMMEGFEKEWNYTKSNRRFVTYTNLPGGKYTFRVKASNNDGIWNDEGTSLRITITPPWWKTLWFNSILIIIFILIIYIAYYLRVAFYKQRQKELTLLVHQRTKDLEESNGLLIERQTQIEKQAEELMSINEQLLARQDRIEEQAEELRTYSDNLKEVNELLIEKQRLILEQSELMQEANQQLSYLNATKDKFFTIIAHDLRNPFNAVSGFSELLIKKIDTLTPDKIIGYLDIIYTASKNGFNLLENLLQWSRSQTGRISFEPIQLNIYAAAEEVVSLLESDAERKKIKILQLIDKNIVVFADENMIKTVFRNLISNAIKFTHENGIIKLKSVVNKNQLELTISDTGIGISKDNIDQLFRIDTTFTIKGTANEIGTGLGLIICKEFIEKHKGKIWVESEEGKGSNFIFTLPLH